MYVTITVVKSVAGLESPVAGLEGEGEGEGTYVAKFKLRTRKQGPERFRAKNSKRSGLGGLRSG